MILLIRYGKGKSLRARFLGPCVSLALLVGAARASAQSTDSKPPQGVAALKAKAESGDAAAQYELGMDYANGQGMPRDYAEAVKWFHKAAGKEFTEAQFYLGFMYESGYGVQKDLTQAAIWYSKAAEKGHPQAQYNIGSFYRDGTGVPQDYHQAALWYRKAAGQGESLAQWCFGELYRLGQGVPVDYAEAYFWLNIAAAGLPKYQGWETIEASITKSRDDAASHLTPVDLARTQERARKWFEDHPAEPQ